MGITVRQGTVGNSRANGQAERVIRAVKDVMRKVMTSDPTSYWSDALPYCLMALRHAPSAAHKFPPFTVITGTTPVLPTQLPDPGPELPTDPTPKEEAEYVDRLMAHTLAIR